MNSKYFFLTSLMSVFIIFCNQDIYSGKSGEDENGNSLVVASSPGADSDHDSGYATDTSSESGESSGDYDDVGVKVPIEIKDRTNTVSAGKISIRHTFSDDMKDPQNRSQQ